MVRRRELQKNGKHLRIADEQTLRDAEKLLNDEFAHVLHIPQQDVPDYIRSRDGPEAWRRRDPTTNQQEESSWKKSTRKRHLRAIGPYSQAMKAGGLLFTSGQIPIDPVTGAVAGEDITAQTEQVMQNLGAVLEAAGTSFQRTVKTLCFLQTMDDFAAFNEVYARYFTEKPARSCVAVRTLPKGVLVEVEAIAEL